MLKRILTLICVATAGTVTAQNIFPATGNVGIGTATPVESLDINGNVIWNGYNVGNPRGVKIGWSGGNYGGIAYNLDYTNTTGVFNRPLPDNSSYLEFTRGGFRFFGTNSPRSVSNVTLLGGEDNLNLLAVISNAGSFGIGTDSPMEKLSVNGNIKIIGQQRGLLIDYASLSETLGGASTIVGNNVMAGSAVNTVKKTYSVADPGSFFSLNYYDGITFHTGITGNLNEDHSVYSSEKMRVTQAGNVGIGTATPNEKLAVNGNIRAREIKVETTNWPDYVFKKDYQLMPLKEVEQHIQQHGHLPDIPKAEQIEAEGLSVGEMNKLLMKKVEELTLYLIEKDKENASLSKQITDIKKHLKLEL